MSDRPWWRDKGKDDLHDWASRAGIEQLQSLVSEMNGEVASCSSVVQDKDRDEDLRRRARHALAHMVAKRAIIAAELHRRNDSSMDSVYDAYLARSEAKP